MRLLLATFLMPLALLAAGCSNDEPAPPAASGHGKEFDGTTTPHIQIKRGERFSVVVPENASVGDKWQLKAPPDQRIAKTENEDYVSDSDSDNGNVGGGGKRFFVFTAAEAGDSSIEIYNCFRGCESEADKQRSVGHNIHLTVAS